MTKQAKLQIGLDIKPLREETKRAKQAIEELGRIKIDKGLRNQIKEVFGKQLQDDVKKYTSELQRARAELRNISSTDAFNASKAQAYVGVISKINAGLAQTKRMQGQISSGGFGGGGGPGGGMGMNLRSLPGAGMVRGATSALGAIGIGLGVSAAVGRTTELARASMGVRQLTGGNTVSGRSDYGFLESERYDRGRAIAAQAGRNMSSQEISKEVDRSEMFERAYGISGEEYAGAKGAAKKAGVGDSGKFVADTIGDAVAMKLEGSAIGEYLSSMTDYLGSVSKGVNVNQGSLRGFAAALGQMDFFKQDPSRTFDAIQQLESIFKGGGNEYQQFGTYQSIQQASMEQNGRGVTPAGADVRQMIGLFGGSEEDAANFRKAGMGDLADVVGIGGDKIMKAGLEREFATAQKAGGGDNQLAAQMFMRNTGLKSQAGLSVFSNLAASGGKMNMKGMDAARKAMKSPEEQAAENMETFDGGVIKFAQRMDDLQNAVSRFITEGVLKFVSSVDSLSKSLGMFESDMAKLGVTIASFVALKSIFDGLKGGGGGGVIAGGKGGLGAVGTVAAGLIALPAAAEIGDVIGKAMRKQLDEWTSGSWGKWWDDFWNKDKNDEDRGAGKYSEKVYTAAEGEGVRLKPLAVTDEAKKLGTYEAELKEKGLPQTEIDEKVSERMRERVQVLKKRQERFDKYKKHLAGEKDVFEADEDGRKKEENKAGLEYRESGTMFEDEFVPVAKAKGGFIRLADGGSIPNKEVGALMGKGDFKTIETDAKGYPKVFRYRGKFYQKSKWSGDYNELEKDTDDFVSIEKTWKDHFAKRAHGGTVGVSSINGWARGGAMGRDNIDAKMMGGEFVVNARDASQNMMALVHANSGGKIKPYADGGTVGDDFAELAEGGVADGMGGIDIGALSLALGGNVEATNMLTKTITQLAAGGGIIKNHPRGPGGMRYGRG